MLISSLFFEANKSFTAFSGISYLNDRFVIPHSLGKSVSEDISSGHLGVEKMKSLGTLKCLWL